MNDITIDRLGRPRDKAIIYFEVDGPTDERGITPFTRVWWDEHCHTGARWRAQCFRASLHDHVQQARATRQHVKVIAL